MIDYVRSCVDRIILNYNASPSSDVQRPLYQAHIFTAGSSYASAVLGIVILSLYLSVCPSLTRVLCDETTEHTANILISHESVVILVF